MKNIQEALEFLRTTTEIPDLAFDEEGVLELIFESDLSVDLIRLDDHTLELSSLLLKLGRRTSPAHLEALLLANHLGEATGAARMALDPEDGCVVLCERVDLTPLTGAQFEKIVLNFTKYAAFWNTQEAIDFISGEMPAAEMSTAAVPGHQGHQMMIRG